MKKLFAIALVSAFTIGCDSSTKDTTETSADSASIQTPAADHTSTVMDDSTKMLDKMLADSTSTYSPDSLKPAN